MKLEDRLKENINKPLLLEEIKRLACQIEANVTELKLKQNIQYIRLNKDGYEIYFHKRKDNMWYLINSIW